MSCCRCWHDGCGSCRGFASGAPAPETPDLHFGNGCSGYGPQQSPAVGRAVAELIVAGAYKILDLGRFGDARVLRNAPLKDASAV